MQIQWYPGHMTKTKRMMESHLALVDLVIELLDARIPYSSRNPDIDRMARDKRRIVVLNKSDLADAKATRLWEKYYTEKGFRALAIDGRDKPGVLRVADLARALTQEKAAKQKQRGRLNAPVRAMVVGIPNVGKSTFINQLAGRAGAAVGDRPGVTRGRQWMKVGTDFDLLDMPGVLWPKFEDEAVGLRLAVTGAISDDILDKVTLCEALLQMLSAMDGTDWAGRYRLKDYENENPRTLLEMIGSARGFKMKGGTIDLERAAIMVLDEFRAGKLGRVTLERPAPASEDPPQS